MGVVPPHATQLSLGAEERLAYRRLADALLQTALREYAAFRVDNPARRVSPLDWKLVKSQDGVAVYKERRPPSARGGRTRDAPPFVPRLLTADGRFERVDANISVPQMLVTGAMRGTVEDALHGAFVDSPETHAARGFYIHDRSSDFRVLARLEEPSESDPHRFCGLAWTEMGGAGVPFVKRRDLLTLISSGMATLASGERVAYYIIHSVSHPQLPALAEHKLLRAKCSFSYLFSQQPAQHAGAGSGSGSGNFVGGSSQVETYQKGFFAPLGDVPERGVVSAVVRTLICPSRLVDAGNNRKLCFMLKHAPPGPKARTKSRSGSHDSFRFTGDDGAAGTDDDDDHVDDEDADFDGCAGGCSRRRSDSFFSSSGGAPFSSSGGPLRKLTSSQQSHGVCVICKLKVCAACKVVKKLAVDATGYELEIKSLGFCLVCVNKAKMLSAPMLARQELLDKQARTVSLSPSSSSVSASTSRPPTKSPPGSHYERTGQTSSASARSPLVEKPSSSARSPLVVDKSHLQRKTSWVGSDTSSTKSSPTVSRDGGPVPTMRSQPAEKHRVQRKTSWVGTDASSSTSLSSDEGSATYTRRATLDKPHVQRTTSWSGVGAAPTKALTSQKIISITDGSTTRTRPPPPPPPSRRSPYLSAGFVPSAEEKPAPAQAASGREPAPRRRAPAPESPLFPVRQPVANSTASVAAAPIRTERRGASPTGGIYLLPTQDQQPAAAATQARRRIDERVAIEDIALRGILL